MVRQLGWTAVLAVLVTAGAAFAKAPEQQALTSESADAIVILQAERWPAPPPLKSAFKLLLSSYDPDEERVSGGPLGKSLLIEAKPSNFIDDYLVARIKPGRWVVQSYLEQDHWGLCFNANTVHFEVRPGQVVFLGRFESAEHHRDLILKVISSGQQTLRGSEFADYFDLGYPPHFAAIDAAQLGAARELIAKRMPGVTAPVGAVQFSPGRFGTGSTLFGERRCGGYFPVSAKRKAD